MTLDYIFTLNLVMRMIDVQDFMKGDVQVHERGNSVY